jgi:hypothetical protein
MAWKVHCQLTVFGLKEWFEEEIIGVFSHNSLVLYKFNVKASLSFVQKPFKSIMFRTY